MSHDATNWAVKQRQLRPSAKVVLWQLCDRYHPDHGCFPSLETLAHDCGMSRRSVQDQIAYLVKSGMLAVAKMPRRDGKLPRNSYHFPFEDAFSRVQQNQAVDLGKSCPGQNLPWANPRDPLGQILPTNPVRRTSKRARVSRTPTRDADFLEADAPPTEAPARPDPSAARTPARPADPPPPPPPPPDPSATRTPARRDPDLTPGENLVGRLTHALGFDHQGRIPARWANALAPMIVSQWITDLHLTPDEIVVVARGNAKAHGSPANNPAILTPAMQEFAARKQAGPLTPTGGPGHERQNRPPRADRRSDAATDALVRRVNAAARIGEAPE